ncbi:MAG TPA: glycosyltransferase [Vicinamibacterales bacterium]|nr:glycosyltransferase [Vicinamibacterales bacterium]
MRIAFDGTSLRPGRTGVGYYTEHLLHHLAAAADGDEIVVVSNRGVETAMPLPSRVRVMTSRRPVPRMVWMQTGAPLALRQAGVDVAHFTNGMLPIASPVPTVVTIHDMSLRLYPRYHPARRVLLNAPLVDLAARSADAIVTVSETAKRDIVRLYKLDAARVHVVHEAAAPSFHRVTDPAELDRVRKRYQLADRIILYVGTIEPRKNLPKLIEAFASRKRAGDLPHHLVCVGPYGWLSRGLEELIQRTRVSHAIHFTGYVPFDDLPALYSLAELFVYPSMYEGFGLPVIEAMACGTPVVTGRAAALAEVGGDAVEQVERMDVDALGEAMARLAREPERRAVLSHAALQRAERFSWDRAARETIEVYRSVAKPAAVRSRFDTLTASGLHKPVTSGFDTLTASARPDPVDDTARPEPVEGRASGHRVLPDRAQVDVLFGQAYFLRFDPKLWDAQQPYAPLGALYAAACARDRGYSVALFDAMLAASEGDWSAALDRHRPRLAVLYEDNFNYLSKMCLLRMRQAALAMIEAARARGVRTIVAGSDATDHPATYLDAGALAVVAGEGEETLVELLDVLTGRRSGELQSVPGVCVRDAHGHLRRSSSRDVIRDLDRLPFPAWDLVDIERYRAIWQRRHGYFSMNVATTRGCPYHCNWCAKPIYGQRYTARSPEHVADEFAWLKRTFAPDHVWIVDDIFGLTPRWIERFAGLVQERGAAIPFKCLLRADQVTTDVVVALRAAKCRTAWVGAESGSQRVLDSMEKGTRVDQIETASHLLHGAGIEVGFFLQFGYPGETREDIELTLDMIRRCRPDDIGISVSYPLPGTTFYQRVKAQLGQKQNWVDSNDLAMMYRATYVPDFYRALHAYVHAEFRARKSAEALRQGHLTALPSLVRRRLEIPLRRHRVDRLARVAPPQPAIVTLPVLTPQAAAIPTEQSR